MIARSKISCTVEHWLANLWLSNVLLYPMSARFPNKAESQTGPPLTTIELLLPDRWPQIAQNRGRSYSLWLVGLAPLSLWPLVLATPSPWFSWPWLFPALLLYRSQSCLWAAGNLLWQLPFVLRWLHPGTLASLIPPHHGPGLCQSCREALEAYSLYLHPHPL